MIGMNANNFQLGRGNGQLGSRLQNNSSKATATTQGNVRAVVGPTNVGMASIINPASLPLATGGLQVAQPAVSAAFAGLSPEVAATPSVGPVVFTPRVIPPIYVPPFLLSKTTTDLARSAIDQLQAVNPAMLREGMNTAKNRNISANGLMNYLERKVKVGEVLNELAKDWSNETKEDFAGAFNMTADKLEVMDSIVSLAILNDPDLEGELQAENTPETTEGDLLENRRIVWQYPPPGTPLEPPYLVLVAVEHRDVAQAEEVVQTILGQLVDYQGYKIPKTAAQKL
jgi:hypothetical protein